MLKKNQAQGPDLTPTLLEMQAQLAQLQAELATLKGLTHPQPQPASEPRPKVSTTRRKLLRQLAGGLVAGLAVGGIGASLPQNAEAKITSNPTGNGLTGRVGMLVMPPGATVSGTMGGVAGTKVGLLVGGDTPTFSIPAVVAPSVNSAIIGYTGNNGTAIAGLSQTGIGIYGHSDANYAVWGVSTSSNGVQGESTSGNGVYGSTTYNGINLAAGVYGVGYNTGIYGQGNFIGVYGKSDTNNSHTGVRGEGFTGLYGYGSFYGVYAICDQFGQAGHFEGDVHVNGTLVKSGGSFKIDHPLDPANKYLSHSFVESPDMLNIYNGLVTLDDRGEATVEMPDWFEALNSDFHYQLTALDSASPDLHIAQRLKGRTFKIAGGKAGQEVSWQVTGIRQDEWAKAHRIPVEETKSESEKGKYLYPQGFGKSEEMSVYPSPVAAK